MASGVIFLQDEEVAVPFDVSTLVEFRRWALSDDFPNRGRIDFIDGQVEVDMAAEEVYSHGALKTELIRVLANRVKADNLGDIFTDSTRVSSAAANLSAEPDIVYVDYHSLDSGEVQRIPKASGAPRRYVELEGGPDLIVEIVGDSSLLKDTKRLPAKYFAAGVREFWLVDARGDDLLFQIHRRGKNAFEVVEQDEEGFHASAVMNCRYQLERRDDNRGGWKFDLIEEV